MAFIPDAPPKLSFVPDKPAAPASTDGSPGLMDIIKGVGDAALSGADRIAAPFVSSPVALANRLVAALSGGDGQAAADAAHDFVTRNFVHNASTPVGRKIGEAVSSALAPLGESAQADKTLLEQGGQKLGLKPGETSNQLSELSDIAGTAGIVAPALAGARASTEAATLAAQNVPTAVAKYGLRTAEDNPIARNVAGDSARPAVTAHNQAIADPVLGAQAGVTPGPPLNADAIEAAQAGPNSVYARAKVAIPTGPLSPKAAQTVNGVGAEDLVTHSPDVQAQVTAQKQRLLAGDLTGSQVVDTSKSLRFNGFRNVASEDPEQVALGRAQLQMSDALHQHMVDTIPADADVSPAQLADARRALAQNYTIGSLLKGNNVDLQALARLHRNSPGVLSGPLKDIAEFADLHPEVTSLPSKAERFNPPGVAKDIAAVDLKSPASYLQPFFGAAARRVLTGPEGAPRVPVTGKSGEFAPLESGPPQPPAGMSLMDELGAGGHPQGPGSGIPLADLLSHGVEQPPAPGLSVGPMGAPSPQGVPFTRNAAHEAGGLETHEPTLMDLLENLRDHPSVMSQGVPEDIMARTNSPFAERGGSDVGSVKAASPEAMNRGTRNVLEIDPDGRASPVLKDVTQIDAKAPKGHLLIDGDTHEILDRGGLSIGNAQGLRNRYVSIHSRGSPSLMDLLEGSGG